MEPVTARHQWIELSRSAYAHNIAFFRRLLGPRAALAVVVKANGYGHGLIEMAGLARENGVGKLCVHTLDEAQKLRESGFSDPILLLGPVPIARSDEAVLCGAALVAYDGDQLVALERAAAAAERTVDIHLKVETGTHRQGVMSEKLGALLDLLKRSPHLRLAALYSHFANIEDTTDPSFALGQLRRFREACAAVEKNGFSGFERHLASSAAAILFPETHFDMVRVGIAQYGLWPSKETRLSYLTRYGAGAEHLLIPVLCWKARIVQIKEVPSGSFIGYGCTYQTTRPSRIAILPIGYSDGYDRQLSNSAHVLVKGQRAPVRGRVAMNLTAIDITDIPGVGLEEEVVLLGCQGEQEVSADRLAEMAGTINYEIVARLAPHIPRIVVP